MLGNYMSFYLKKMYNHIIIPITRNDCDINNINDIKEYLIKKNIQENDLVINCIGIIPQRNNDKYLFYKINSIFPIILSYLCNEFKCRMIHFTTDCVFDGTIGNYNENSPHTETNDYGISKSLGENCDATIIRTSIIGEEEYNKKSLLEWVRSNKNGTIDGYNNHYWNGLTCLELAKVVEYMINNNIFWKGVRHIFSPNILSKCELVNMINEIYLLNIKINISNTNNNINKTLSSIYEPFYKIKNLEDQIKELYNFKMIKNFTIYGERCSGTNYLEELIINNFHIDITWEYGWKHFFGFYEFDFNDKNSPLFIGIVRNPIDWINSFSKEQHHIENRLKPINNFLFDKVVSVDEFSSIIKEDLNYVTKENYKNIFELRKYKNDYLMNIMPTKANNYILLNYENLRDNTFNVLEQIRIQFNLIKKNTEYVYIHYYQKRKDEIFYIKNISLSNIIINKIKMNLDIDQELKLNYNIQLMKKTIVTVSGIRPDFIRMSSIFKKLDEHFNHILIHTGQHYDKLLSDVFFEDLDIRKPDYTLETGKNGSNHYYQLSYLSVEIIELFKKENIKPDIILFLGDSNTVCAALPLRKEGYIIGHIEAGMRSYDKRMFEEINRTVCDHCSHVLFVYHEDYKKQVEKENIIDNVHVVGNTIVEVVKPFIPTIPKRNDMILLDIHRPENFKYIDRMVNIIKYANMMSKHYNLPIKMLRFYGTNKMIEENNLDLGNIIMIDLLCYKKYIDTIYHCKFIISDSGTGQEEPALLRTPVIVPRDFTERPQSVQYNCSFMLNANDLSNQEESINWLNNNPTMDTEWLGDGTTSDLIVEELLKYLNQ